MPVKSILFGIVVLIGLLMFYAGFVVVNPGHVGVVKRLGAVSPTPLAEGFHLKIPFVDIVEEIDIRLQPARVPGSAASKDLQQVDTTIVLQYSMSGKVSATQSHSTPLARQSSPSMVTTLASPSSL